MRLDAADGCCTFYSCMRSMPIIPMKEGWEFGLPLLGRFEGGGVGPLAKRGLDEALSLAVRLRGVGSGAQMLDVAFAAGCGECLGSIARSIVGHDAGDGDAEALEIGDGIAQSRDGAGFLLIWHDVDPGDARVVVNSDMREFPAGAACTTLAAPVTGDAMASPAEFSKLFDVEMDDLAGRLAFVARAWFPRLDGRQQAKAALGEDA